MSGSDLRSLAEYDQARGARPALAIEEGPVAAAGGPAAGPGSDEAMRWALRVVALGRFASFGEVVDHVVEALGGPPESFAEFSALPWAGPGVSRWRRVVALCCGVRCGDLAGMPGSRGVMGATLRALGSGRVAMSEACELAASALGEAGEESARALDACVGSAVGP